MIVSIILIDSNFEMISKRYQMHINFDRVVTFNQDVDISIEKVKLLNQLVHSKVPQRSYFCLEGNYVAKLWLQRASGAHLWKHVQ